MISPRTREKNRLRQKRYRDERQAGGMCGCCGLPPKPGFRSCEKRLRENAVARMKCYNGKKPRSIEEIYKRHEDLL